MVSLFYVLNRVSLCVLSGRSRDLTPEPYVLKSSALPIELMWLSFYFHDILYSINTLLYKCLSERKQIDARSLKRIQCDVLEADLIGVNIDRECTDVNLVV